MSSFPQPTKWPFIRAKKWATGGICVYENLQIVWTVKGCDCAPKVGTVCNSLETSCSIPSPVRSVDTDTNSKCTTKPYLFTWIGPPIAYLAYGNLGRNFYCYVRRMVIIHGNSNKSRNFSCIFGLMTSRSIFHRLLKLFIIVVNILSYWECYNRW